MLSLSFAVQPLSTRIFYKQYDVQLRKSFWMLIDHRNGCGYRQSKWSKVDTTEISYKENKFGPDLLITTALSSGGSYTENVPRKAGRKMAKEI